jgi:type I restriction enzyme, S subunit
MMVAGSDWLPMLQRDWRAVPSKALFALRSEPNSASDEHLTPSQKYGVIPQTEYMEVSGSRVVLALTGADRMQHVEPGDFVIHLRSFQGGIEFSQYRGKVSPAYTVLCPRADVVHAPFYRHMLKSDRYIQALRVTVNQLRDGQSIRYQDFGKVALPLPSLEEQITIANFLDREIPKIDSLIGKQRDLIAVLQARRQATIDASLDELSAPRVRLGRVLAGIKDGTHGTIPRVDHDTGFPLLSAKNVTVHGLSISSEESFIAELDHLSITANGYPQRGDVLLVIIGATIGKSIIYNETTTLSFQRSVAMLRPKRDLIGSKFLWFVVQSSAFQAELRLRANVSAQPGVYLGAAGGISLPVPSLEVQRHIEAHLEAKMKTTEAAVSRAEKMIALSQERRAALITAVVTGQLDIRGAA